jgi:hypothetical protein
MLNVVVSLDLQFLFVEQRIGHMRLILTPKTNVTSTSPTGTDSIRELSA